MEKYNVAELCFMMEPDAVTKRNASKYRQDEGEVLFEIFPRTKEDYDSKERNYSFEDYQYLTLGNAFYRNLILNNGVMLHSSAVVVDDKAYLFSAPSGTGKSTHTSFWLELFGERAFVINDDKPAIRILDDGIFVYGTPWSGKHDISANTRAKLQGICFLNRDENNWIERMDYGSALIRMLHQSMHGISEELTKKQLNIISNIISSVPIYEMGCTPTVEAAQMAYKVMSRGESNEKK